MKLESLTLGQLGNGAAEELFQRELLRVVKNVQDPNTDYRRGRSISLKVDIIPTSENRNQAEVRVSATSGLVSGRPATTTAFFGMQDGKMVVNEFDPEQMTIGEDQEEDPTTDLGPRGIVESAGGGE